MSTTEEDLERLKDISDASDDPELMWTLIPWLFQGIVSGTTVLRTTAGAAIPRNWLRGINRRFGPRIVELDGHSFISTSRQTDRVLQPLIDALSVDVGTPTTATLPRLGPLDSARAVRRGQRLGNQLTTALTQRGYPRRYDLADEAQKAAVMLERCRIYVQEAAPKVLTTAHQHNSVTRAMLRRAVESQVVRTLYLPHAPLAETPLHLDLPVTNAALRGPAEVERFESIIGSRAGLTVVGNPSLSHWPSATAPRSGGVVFATKFQSPESMSEVIDVIDRALPDGVEVLPHPRLELELYRDLWPRHWTITTGTSTFERLSTSGASAVIQNGSGAGLEALALGLRLVDIHDPDDGADYLYLASPLVDQVRSSAELRAAAMRPDEGDEASLERADYARSWCSTIGDAAIDRFIDTLHAITDAPPRDRVILDTWSNSST